MFTRILAEYEQSPGICRRKMETSIMNASVRGNHVSASSSSMKEDRSKIIEQYDCGLLLNPTRTYIVRRPRGSVAVR